jgi:hypothetical protein
MPTNRKRLVVPTSMGADGFEVLKTRDDVEVIPFPPMISSPDFNSDFSESGAASSSRFSAARLSLGRSQRTVARRMAQATARILDSTCAVERGLGERADYSACNFAIEMAMEP